MTQTEFENLKNNVLSKLKNGLPKYLHYHCLNHTKRVLEKSKIIAKAENVSADDLLLIKIAALYHDYGFLSTYHNHENEGCKAVQQELKHQLNQDEINAVCGMIKATEIPQTPNNLKEKIIADADLEYLGTDDFTEIANKLYLELKSKNPDLSLEEWNKIQISFIENHSFFTDYAKKHLTAKKQENLLGLKDIVSKKS